MNRQTAAPVKPNRPQSQSTSISSASSSPFDLRSTPAADLVNLAEKARSIASPTSPPALPTRVIAPRGDRVAEIARVGAGIESLTHRIIVSVPSIRLRVIVAEVTNLYAVVWSPDGSKIAFCEGTILHVADADGRTHRVLHVGPGGPYPGACFGLSWTARGDEISFVEVQNAGDPELANPIRVTLTLGRAR